MADTQTALATTEAPQTPAVITTPAEYGKALKLWVERNYHVLTPFTNLSGLAERHGIITTMVKLNTDPALGEVYGGLPFLKGEKGTAGQELAIAKNGLRKIAECAGVSTSTVRTDPRTIPHYWEFKCVASYVGLDGSVIRREATMEWDLRDGSDRLKGWTPNQISEGRKNGLRSCEARAINAAIRECGVGIRQKYTKAELERPFIVIRVAYQPDMTDPQTRQLVTERALAGTSALYPSRSLGMPTGQVIDADPVTDDEPRTVGASSSAPAAATSTPAAPSKPTEDLPPTERAVRIVDVKSKTGEKNGRAWEKFTIVDSHGQEHTTFSKSIADTARKAQAARAWIEIEDEPSEDGKYHNIAELAPAGQQPALAGLDPDSL